MRGATPSSVHPQGGLLSLLTLRTEARPVIRNGSMNKVATVARMENMSQYKHMSSLSPKEL